jgi:hypothetical protein
MSGERGDAMSANGQRHEVVVTDLRMRFGSMVLFMVKWAIASIPALIILVVLGVAFSGLAIGFFASLSGLSHRQSSPGDLTKGKSAVTAPSASSGGAHALGPEEVAYLPKVLVKGVHVGKSALDETGVFGEIKNTGDRTLRQVEITIYCLGPQGKPVFEKTYHPVMVSEFSFDESGQPLKPGYSRQFGVKLEDAPSDWSRKVDVKVTHVEFQ